MCKLDSFVYLHELLFASSTILLRLIDPPLSSSYSNLKKGKYPNLDLHELFTTKPLATWHYCGHWRAG